jgi:hypothetical protein
MAAEIERFLGVKKKRFQDFVAQIGGIGGDVCQAAQSRNCKKRGSVKSQRTGIRPFSRN